MDSSEVLILKTYEEVIGHTPGWSNSYIWWLLAGILLLGIGILLMVKKPLLDSLVVVTVMAGMFSIAIFILSICLHTPVTETRYVVLPTEDVGLVEFYDKYDVIEQDGMTYIVREKNKAS